jgi:hypothetical protein
MPTHNTNPNGTQTSSSGKVPKPTQTPDRSERERLRDIIVVFVTYPLTPNEKSQHIADKKPWLEFVSLLLKVLLALYAVVELVWKGE